MTASAHSARLTHSPDHAFSGLLSAKRTSGEPRYDRAPPRLDEHGDRIRAWLTGADR